jgi:hypothetical protein
MQQKIEAIIKASIPAHSYGSSRENPTAIINASGHFFPVTSIEQIRVPRTTRVNVAQAGS